TGVVYDQNGLPVIGANVIEKGTTNGVITDIDGKFSLTVSDNAVIQVSYIGYIGQDVAVGNRSDLTIALKEDSQALDEVVVVGYGVQKKVNVVGSISQVNSEALQSRSTPQLSNALTGQMTGVTVIQRSGRPGASEGEIRVRGVGSFGATPSALVLIDGVPGDMNEINTDDVESISVLKDASTAAIYGARAANGVILITTKSGKEGKISISYNGYVGTSVATAIPEFVDTWEYCTLVNRARGTEVYSPEEIAHYKNGTGDPDKYGNARYIDEVLSRNGLQTGHDFSLNGGNEKTRYLTSFGFLTQNGLVDKNDYTRYNARINLSTKLLPNLKMTTRFSGMYSNLDEPVGDDPQTMLGLITRALRLPGLTPSILSDGSYALANDLHGTPLAWLQSESFYWKKKYRFNANVSLEYSPIKDLKLTVMGAYDNNSVEDKRYRSTQTLSGGITIGPATLKQQNDRTIYKTFQATAEYNKLIGKHDIGVLLGYSWEQEDFSDLDGFRDNFPGNNLPYIDAGSPSNQKSNGSAWGWALQSYFGRVQYNYAERYLLESTVRYDGSSRFPAGNRFGLFPSVAAGWRISEESFFKENEKLDWISGLKIKASWGRLGNSNIANYPYQSVYTLNQDYPIGGTLNQGGAILNAVDHSIKWEETETIDTGIEAVLWNGLLNFNASYFYRNTYDILYKPNTSVSLVLGKDISEMNIGKLKNKGWELEIGHTNKIGDFSYGINTNLTIIHNKVSSLGIGNVEQLNGLVGDGSDLFVGHPMQLYYGYKTDGVFLDEADINNWYDQSAVNPKPQPGDIRYLDISGPDGVPDGKVDPNYDRVPLGSRIPKYTFGLNLNLAYKGFDFSALIQGVAGVKGYLNGYAGYALANQSNIQRWQADGCFDPENPVRYPEYPRIQDLGNSTPPNYQKSDFWILDASYVRLKNVQIGYTLPKSVLSKLNIGNLRVYMQAENPLSIHGYRKGWDPEINTDGSDYYPIIATYTFGVNLKF
ncbi:MAG: SusC/RagA family TonB-linked outer membrane protein, partial [Parabacteroides gordonii]|uniref:SusC/RagA family TonB-linked outer membrane protein n=1 Tax=Parabacteroides gordonii TaxID=574930 RepID=UPI003A89C8D2